tara:strand:- start:39 stop:224 length:186 start_codon:yes stop_codon:yes gene_type:complete
MKNYTIAKKNLKMNNNWNYALSIEGRKAFQKGSKEVKTEILTQLVDNGNISMIQLLQIMSK